jgi:hypothetical protein
MWAFYVLLAPLVALIVWGVVYDIKRRRRDSPINNHDVEAVAKRLGGSRRDGRIPEQPGIRSSVGDIGDVFGP